MYPPEEPRNLTMVFEPKREVTLLLDQVKTAVDLNDDFTEWNNHNCNKKEQEVDRKDGRFIACKLNLRGKYEQDGQYGDGLGSSYSPINFTVTVTNIFGSTKPISHIFLPHDYIKPNKLRGIKVMDQKSDSRIVLQHVVVEKHEGTYDISWSVADVAEADRFLSKYHVHHCYAEELPGVTSQKWNKLNCRTNMVTEQVNSSTRIRSVTVPTYRGSANSVLTPTFFVSLETKNGSHSTLVKPECLYARDRGEEFCVEGEVKANMEVKKIIPGLKADTSYCVGVKVIKSNINPVWDMAVGKTGVTKKNVEVTMIALGGVSACLVAIVMVVL
nr:hypothetical protein BaRGS_017021 [Batillaria attramentaria]